MINVSAQTKPNRIYDLDNTENNDFNPLIFANTSQYIFNIKVNLTQSELLSFGLRRKH